MSAGHEESWDGFVRRENDIMSDKNEFDIVAIGRSSVVLCGQQIGSGLEDTESFRKTVGGTAAGIAIGAARLGLKSALIARIGDEPMGRFVHGQLIRERVNVRGVCVDPKRLTSLVLQGAYDEDTFSRVLYGENSADSTLEEDDIDETFLASSRAVVVTGSYFACAGAMAAQRKAIRIARAHGIKVVLDIDYRPGLADSGAHLASLLPLCDLIVGSGEGLNLVGGGEDVPASLRAIRARSPATLVCERGPMGCAVFPGEIADHLDDGLRGPGLSAAAYGAPGVGEVFVSGFLRGWLRGESPATCGRFADACTGLAVSRLPGIPESPTWPELAHFLDRGCRYSTPREDPDLGHLHWATTRRPQPETVMALAIDHRAQLEAIADAAMVSRERIDPFKTLAVRAAVQVARDRPGFGMLLDGTYGRHALLAASHHPLWLARPVEQPGSRPLRFDGYEDLGSQLIEWPATHTIKCLCFYHPEDPRELKAEQERMLRCVFEAARRIRRELLIEIIAGKSGPLSEGTVAEVLSRLYDLGIRPDWWKLEPQKSEQAWRRIGETIAERDPFCRGVILLGLEAPAAELQAAFRVAASVPQVRGFAVGRTIFAEAANKWLRGQIDDDGAVKMMAGAFGNLVEAWQSARKAVAGTAS